jgi:RHS repeat-associated protein
LNLHHDQQGSTRLLTGSSGKTEASFTCDAYGNLTGSTGTAKTPLGYDGQYTSSDTGLIYLRARTYDPATAQFMSVDPEVEATRAVYAYAGDDPLVTGDPTGRSVFGDVLEAAHYIFTAGAIGLCATQPELCAGAALIDVLLNSADTGVQAAAHEKSVVRVAVSSGSTVDV